MGLMTVLARTGEFTREDLDAMPDDGHRHELLDGSIVMTPSPGYRHQRMSLRLAVLLLGACPEGLEVLHRLGLERVGRHRGGTRHTDTVTEPSSHRAPGAWN